MLGFSKTRCQIFVAFCSAQLVVCFSLIFIPNSIFAEAQNVNAFYEKNTAIDFFGDKIKELDSRDYKHLPEKKEIKKSESDKIQKEDEIKKLAVPESDAEAGKDPSERILAKYGDPGAEPRIQAQDNAPAPFKGMLEALDAGNKPLAYQYAKQYVRHMQKLQTVINESIAFQGAAMKSENLLPEKSWFDTPEYSKYRKYLYEDEEKSAAADVNGDLSKANKITSKERDLIQQVLNAESQPTKGYAPFDPRAAETQSAGLVPNQNTIVDPKGLVDLFFFFDPNQKESWRMAKEVETLYKGTPNNGRVRINGLSLKQSDQSILDSFAGIAGVTFKVSSGEKIAKELKLKTTPSVLIVARTTRDAILEEGFRDSKQLAQIVSAVKGGK